MRGRRLTLAAAAFVGMSALALPLGASASNANKSTKNCTSANGVKIRNNALVCQGLAFYRGQTMTIYNIASIGGPFDDLDITAQPFLQQFLGVTANITSITTGNSIPGQDALASSTPNGLTIGVLNPLNDASLILEKTPGINFNPARMVYLAATGPSPQPLIATPSSGYTTFNAVIAASKAGTLKTLTQNTGTANTLLRAWFGVMGLKPTWVTGYTSLSNEVTGLVRGDGPMAMVTLSNSCSLLQANQAVAIATNSVPPLGTNCRKYLTGIPSFKSLAKQYGTTRATKKLWSTILALDAASGTPFVTQTSVPGYKTAALRAAMQWMFKQTGFITQMESFGLNPTYTDPVVAKTDYQTTVALGSSVICYVEGTC
jgi:hypothetical protein